MKKIFSFIAIASVLILSACDSMLDTTNWDKKDTSNFPQTEKDAYQIILGIHNALVNTISASSPDNNYIFYGNAASDEMFGGGGEDRLMYSTAEGFQYAWKGYYQGIFRANYALSVIPEMDDALFSDIDTKNYYIGQAYFLRAWYFFQMAQTFETFPMILTTDPVNEPRTDVETIYAQIASDLNDAIKYMPSKYGYTQNDVLVGLSTKYAAEALAGRVYLFYTGFYNKSDLPGLTKSQVVSYLKDCRDNSGFGLERDQREIWPYTNGYTTGFNYGTDFDVYPSRNDLHWVGNHSKETVFAAHFSLVAWVGFNRIGEFYTGYVMGGVPNIGSYPIGSGYSMGKVNSKFVENWATDPDYGFADKRLWGTVYATNNADQIYSWMNGQYVELPNYVGSFATEEEHTYFWQKKYAVIAAYSDANKSKMLRNFFYATPVNNCYNHNLYDNRNDAIFIRYADVLLMLDELEQTVTGMNKIRERAGLAPYSSYTFERLQKERQYEFAFEGIRFNDLRRWYPDTAGKIIADNQKGAYITFRGKVVDGGWKEMPGNSIEQRYAQTRGFWRIPSSEISLSEGVLDQNKGWEDDNNTWFLSSDAMPY